MARKPIPGFMVWFLIIGGLVIIGTGFWQLWGPQQYRDGLQALFGFVLGAVCTVTGVFELRRKRDKAG